MKLRCHLMSSGIDEATGKLFIRLDPEGAGLFENLAYLQWETRLSLPSAISKALHLYVCGHRQGRFHTVKVADLALWMGYQGRLRQFRANLETAVGVLCAHGVIERAGFRESGKTVFVEWVRSAQPAATNNIDII
jgi:hypothetical protein